MIVFLKKSVSLSNVLGITYDYSNLTYVMLGSIIQKVSGISYQEYVAKNICAPLNMRQASWEFRNIPSDELAQGYRWIDSDWQTEEIFSENFFLDNPLNILQKKTGKCFDRVGEIMEVQEVIAESQLSGYFLMKGKKSSLKIDFSLTPHYHPLIQKFSIEELNNE